jgi:hypothetical protein
MQRRTKESRNLKQSSQTSVQEQTGPKKPFVKQRRESEVWRLNLQLVEVEPCLQKYLVTFQPVHPHPHHLPLLVERVVHPHLHHLHHLHPHLLVDFLQA